MNTFQFHDYISAVSHTAITRNPMVLILKKQWHIVVYNGIVVYGGIYYEVRYIVAERYIAVPILKL